MNAPSRITHDVATQAALAIAALQHGTQRLTQEEIPGFIKRTENCLAQWATETVNTENNAAIIRAANLMLYYRLDGHLEYIAGGPDWSVLAVARHNDTDEISAATLYFPSHQDKFLLHATEQKVFTGSDHSALSIPATSRDVQYRRVCMHVPRESQKNRPPGTVPPFASPASWSAGEFLTTASLSSAVRKILLRQVHVIATQETNTLDSALVAMLKAAGLTVTQVNGQNWQPGSSLLCSSLSANEHAEYVVVD